MLDKNGVLLVTSQDDFYADEKIFLSGTLIVDGFILDGEGFINQSELKKIPRKNILNNGIGKYLLAIHEIDTLSISTDSSGSEPLFIYREQLKWIVSNSLQALAKKASDFGWKITLNENVIASCFVDHSIGRMPLSSSTIYNEVKLVLLDRYIKIKKISKTIEIVFHDFRFESIYSGASYEDSLINWFRRWRGILSAIAYSKNRSPVLLDLSGGLDSRLVLSIAMPVVAMDSFSVFTQKNSPADASIANSIGDLFGFSVENDVPDKRQISGRDQYEKYVLGNVGFYHLPVAPVHSMNPSDQFRINGIGGEVLRDFYAGSGLDWVKKIKLLLPDDLRGRYGEGVCRLLKDSYEELKIDPTSPHGLREHYRQLRSRLHGGRRLHEKFKYKFLSPLTDPSLKVIASLKGAPDTLGLYRDILLVGGGKSLALYPFDSAKKNFNDNFLKNSAFYFSSHAFSKLEAEEFSYFSIGEDYEISLSKGVGVDSSGVEGRNLDEMIYGMTSVCLKDGALDLLPNHVRDIYFIQMRQRDDSRSGKINRVIWHSLMSSTRFLT